MSAEFTAAVKRHLKITWASEDTDAEVASIMSRAESMLDDLLGEPVDFASADVSGRDLDLYLNLCLYLYNGLTEDDFVGAYGKQLNIARQFHCDPIGEWEDEDE